jgi:hypothetical protein
MAFCGGLPGEGINSLTNLLLTTLFSMEDWKSGRLEVYMLKDSEI